MWTKILIFMIIFFLVASPATFKVMRKLLGAWVASAEGLATPAGLALHAVVLVLLGIYLPRVLMTYEADEEYEEYETDEEYEGEVPGETIDDRVAALEGAVPESELEKARLRLRRCPKCPKCMSQSTAVPGPAPQYPTAVSMGSAPPMAVSMGSAPPMAVSMGPAPPTAVSMGSGPPVTVATTSGPNPQAILAPGAVPAASPNSIVITPPVDLAPAAAAVGAPVVINPSTPTPALTPAPAPAPAGTTSPYFEWNY